MIIQQNYDLSDSKSKLIFQDNFQTLVEEAVVESYWNLPTIRAQISEDFVDVFNSLADC